MAESADPFEDFPEYTRAFLEGALAEVHRSGTISRLDENPVLMKAA